MKTNGIGAFNGLRTMNSINDYRQAVVINALGSCPVFDGLSADDLQCISHFTSIKRLSKGETLFTEGSTVHGFYVVQSGAIKLRKLNANGHEQVIHVFRAPESVGEDMLLSSPGYCADACATEPSQVLLIQKEPLISMLKDRPELSLHLLASNARHFELLVQLLCDMGTKDVETRLRDWLLQHCPDPESNRPQTIRLPMTKRLLAAELGICGETLSRAFTKFRQRNLLIVNGRNLVLRCPPQLAQ